MQRKGLGRSGAVVGRDFDDGFRRRRTISFEQFLGLAFQLIDVGVLAHDASGRFLTHMISFPGRAFWRAPLLPVVRCAGLEKSSFHELLGANHLGVDAVLPRTWLTPRAPTVSIPKPAHRCVSGRAGEAAGGRRWLTRQPEIEALPGGSYRLTSCLPTIHRSKHDSYWDRR
jgi:hypothetical protein